MTDSAQPDVAASMSLLKRIVDGSLDPGYRSASQEPKTDRSGAAKVLWQLVVFLAAVALMWGATVAARSLHTSTLGQERPAATLSGQVQESAATVKSLEAETQLLAERVAAFGVESAVTNDADPIESATTRVQGPGVVLSITDSFGGGPGLIQDGDIRTLLNALWAGGADAIAVNGSRIGPQTTVRTAGSSILVNLQPISSPYVIEAIGDPAAMTGALSSGSASKAVRNLETSLGMNVKTTQSENLVLSAQTPGQFFYAQPAGSMEDVGRGETD